MFYTDYVFWITIMFIAVVGFGSWVAIAWIEKDKPPESDYEPIPHGHLKNLDGYELCPGCRHPKVAAHTIRKITIEGYP